MNGAQPNVLIAGYFYRNNLGDDLFVEVYKYILSLPEMSSFTADYISIDDLVEYTIPDSIKLIVLAGGDILNEYFLGKVKETILRCNYKKKVVALSVGIPYIKPLDEGYLDFLNYISCRSTVDTAIVRRRFSEQSIMYYPDISVLLPRVVEKLPLFRGLQVYSSSDKPKVGVFLTRDIYTNNKNYHSVVKSFAHFIDNVTSQGREVFLIPFNTNDTHTQDNDTLLNRDIFDCLDDQDAVHIVTDRFTVSEMYLVFKQLSMSICMRYHAHMMSVICGVPLFSIYTTGKVNNLLEDLKMKGDSFKMTKDLLNLPVSLDVNKVTEKFEKSFRDRTESLPKYKSYLSSPVENFTSIFQKLLEAPRIGKMKLNSGQNMVSAVQSVTRRLVNYILEDSKSPFLESEIDPICFKLERHETSLYDFVTSTGTKKNLAEMGSMLAALACSGLINTSFPKYHFGMSQKILTPEFQLYTQFKYVWEDYHYNKIYRLEPKKEEPLFNAREVDTEHLKDCHRSGWNYVLGGLMPFDSKEAPILFDNFVDRTFHWTHTFYKYTGVIPFKQPWCGFIHHVTDQTFSKDNVHNLFKNETFLESLNNCVALFTLSCDLERKVRLLLDHQGYHLVKTKSFVHPTEFVECVFSFESYIANREKKLIQIGGWLRDPYALYRLVIPNKSIQKCALKGKNMGNYFKPPDLEISLISKQYHQEDTYQFDSLEPSTNKFTSGLLSHINQEFKSVRILETVSNEEYDTLLSKNLVFLFLVDASAVNTIIECIVRGTPVLVNRIPPVVEALGEGYPFFYNNLSQASEMAVDLELIKKTHVYLSVLDKTPYKLSSFIESFRDFFSILN